MNKFQALTNAFKKTYTALHERHQHHVGADQSSLYIDQQSLPGTQTEEEEGVASQGCYLASHRGEQENPEEESHGHRKERLKERYRQQYREANWAVKKLIRAEKRAYLEDLASQTKRGPPTG